MTLTNEVTLKLPVTLPRQLWKELFFCAHVYNVGIAEVVERILKESHEFELDEE